MSRDNFIGLMAIYYGGNSGERCGHTHREREGETPPTPKKEGGGTGGNSQKNTLMIKHRVSKKGGKSKVIPHTIIATGIIVEYTGTLLFYYLLQILDCSLTWVYITFSPPFSPLNSLLLLSFSSSAPHPTFNPISTSLSPLFNRFPRPTDLATYS